MPKVSPLKMPRLAASQPQRPAGEFDLHAVRALDHPLRGHRHDVAEQPGHLAGAVDLPGTGDQPRRIDQVARAAWVHDQPGPGTGRHQRPGAPAVIEVDVGRHHVIDVVGRQPELPERLEGARCGEAGPGVDERGAAILDDQVEGIECRADVAGIDAGDAVVKGRDRLHGLSVALGGLVTASTRVASS
jgi:hypothetical protein